MLLYFSTFWIGNGLRSKTNRRLSRRFKPEGQKINFSCRTTREIKKGEPLSSPPYQVIALIAQSVGEGNSLHQQWAQIIRSGFHELGPLYGIEVVIERKRLNDHLL